MKHLEIKSLPETRGLGMHTILRGLTQFRGKFKHKFEKVLYSPKFLKYCEVITPGFVITAIAPNSLSGAA